MKGLVLIACILTGGFCHAQEEKNAIKELGQKRAQMEIQVSAYPNPSHGNIFVEGKEGSTVVIYSSEGTYVGTWVIGNSSRVEITDLPVGTFLCEINDQETRVVRRIVVL